MKPSEITVVILAGGLGTRLREETEYKPKPMVEIGGRPILWHIMKNLSVQGISRFIVCTGYKSQIIKDYFLNYNSHSNDIKITLGEKTRIDPLENIVMENWEVSIIYTGEDTPTGGRLFKIRKFVNTDFLLCVYGDGLSDINISQLLDEHSKSKKYATVTSVQPISRFGVLDIAPDNEVLTFKEKPRLDGWINAGYFIFQKGFLDSLSEDSTLETQPLFDLARDRKLNAFKHVGFWQPMDTYRESNILNDLWKTGNAPWKNW